MPSSTGSPVAGLLALRRRRWSLSSSNSTLSTCSLGRSVGVARVGDLDLLQHLADDHLDVLVVDLHALQAVDLLDFVHQVSWQAPRRP